MYIDPDDVINKDNLKQIESSAVCSICSGIVIEPVQCLLCENSFCKNCLEDWPCESTEIGITLPASLAFFMLLLSILSKVSLKFLS